LSLPTALVLTALALLSACGGDDDETTAADEARSTPESAETEQPLPPAEEHGMELFVRTCGACHTFEAAGTIGSIGPNLDELPLDAKMVLKAIRIGGRGTGNMPPNLYEGKDARDVAAFVANNGPGP
jgi:mono/diheme cytochrome c family protein